MTEVAGNGGVNGYFFHFVTPKLLILLQCNYITRVNPVVELRLGQNFFKIIF